MLTITFEGEEIPFEGINGELDGRGYSNATEFYNKTNSTILQFEELTETPCDMYHSMFMNNLFEYIKGEIEKGTNELNIDLEILLNDIGGQNELYTVKLKKKRANYIAPQFVTYFKLVAMIDFLMIPIHNIRMGEGNTEVLYGEKVMFSVSPKNRRFPAFVSERILSGEIEKASQRQILGYKFLDIDKLLKYDVMLDYINYKG